MAVSFRVHPEAVLVHPPVTSREALLEHLVSSLMKVPEMMRQPGISRASVLDAVASREAECPTGVGNGFAIPHARLPALRSPAIAFAILAEGVDFDAPDGVPCNLVCLLAIPDDAPQVALQLMAHFSNFLLEPSRRQQLMEMRRPAAIARFLQSEVLASSTPVYARDIMRAPFTDVYPETPLRDVTRNMLTHGVDSVSVVDANDRLVGVITSDDLFKSGMPPFFQHLRTVSFIREYDPVAKYFEGESTKLASDVMTQDFATVAEDDTLIEVIFLLAIKGYPKVYVVKDGIRVGVIDRFVVLERVVNF